MNKKLLISGSILGLLSVVLGAFGAHGLENELTAKQLQSFETAVRYQMYHALLLLIVGNIAIISQKSKRVIYYLVLIGIILFSGSIYGLATNDFTSFNFTMIGFITPIGGLLLIASWVVLLINFIKLKENK